ncbi:MAG: bifunctional glutamate N-acetyltransferase/amino-acid acetyltransferase ArgJ [Candidatus Latescibacteria bacterium]|nr:bifunctional glutamate N-acetyltransferase/amino-acid acetyltransferase ArgJ [Candidatus Latescibacterota bacterium]
MYEELRVKDITGGITAPEGFRAGVAECSIKKPGRPDLTVILSDVPASCAGMFTSNRIKGAPVLVSRENVKKGSARAIIANSGNANVCNGEDGLEAAVAMTGETARLIGCDSTEVLVASTGVIGRPFPIEKVLRGIPQAIKNLSNEGSNMAARAIMTTDTVPKETAVEIDIEGVPVKIGAIAKGSGMINPDMATMFCFITSDISISQKALRKALKIAVDKSFNCITVDGDMSTSDTVLMLANGKAGNALLKSRSRHFDTFADGLSEVCLRMAKALIKDGEGATRFITIQVTGAAGKDDAIRAGMAVANSALFKTACFGSDPNWGRIICAAGYSGVPIDENHITISINGVTLFEIGRVLPMDEKKLREEMSGSEITVTLNLGMGHAEATIYTSDLSYEYIKINAEYTT